MQHLRRPDAIDDLDRRWRRGTPATSPPAGARRLTPPGAASRSWLALPLASIARYAVGAVKQAVAPCSAIRSASSSGVAFSTSRELAPTRSGKTTSPPSPNVNASGGVPMNTSSAVGFSTCLENVSALASTSRWKCIVAFGRPVVPDVNASRATSSAAVSTSSNVDRPSVGQEIEVAAGLRRRTRRPRMPGMSAPTRSSRKRWSHSARSTAAISATVRSSPGRSSGIVVTTTAPALSTPNQQATNHGLFGPRSRTRLPGTTPSSSTRTCATWFALLSSSSYVHHSWGEPTQGRSPPCRSIVRSSSSVAQLSRSGYWTSGRSKSSSGHWSAGGRLSRQNVSTCADGVSCM